MCQFDDDNIKPTDDSNYAGIEYIESPMPSGTIEEDFEEALVKEAATTGDLASPKTSLVFLKSSKGKSSQQSSIKDENT